MYFIPISLRPMDEVLIEFYTFYLPMTIEILMKRMGKATLRDTFDEEVKVENEILS